MPITEVSLAQVTDQYIEYIEHQSIPSDELADFLVVAAKLLYMKSKVLLPTIDLGLEDEGIPLEEQLRIYKEFLNASKRLEAQIKEHRFAYAREKAPIQIGVFTPPAKLTRERLVQAFRDVLTALEPVVHLPKVALARAVSIEERIGHLRDLLAKKASVSFGLFLRSAENKTDVIVSFLALLEMVKQRAVIVTQEGLFSDMTIEQSKS